MSGRFRTAITAALEGSDLAPLRACLLQRVCMEAGFDEFAGRDAVLGWFQALSAAFTEARIHALREIQQDGIVLLDFQLEGAVTNIPLIGGSRLAEPLLSADLPIRLWFRLEQDLAVEVTAVTDWTRIIAGAGISLDDIARATGEAAPCHRPLGELTSGRGQLGPDETLPNTGWATAFNGRSFQTGAQQQQLQQLVTQLPDATLAIEQVLTAGDSKILLLRLMGHSNGRRVSLAASKVVGGERDAGASEPLRFDPVALAAVRHRPFHPE